MNRVVLVLICFAVCVDGFSNGRVTDSCMNLQPRHNVNSPQMTNTPFTVTTDQTNYTVGQDITVRLGSPSSQKFKGFLLQAREVDSLSPVGSFITVPAEAQTLSCSQKANSAVSHVSDSSKSLIQVTWRPANGFDKPIQFHATFVQNFQTFWVDVKGPIVRLTGSGGSNTTFAHEPTSSSTERPSTVLPAPPLDISSADCSVSKVCFREPADCDPVKGRGCYFMSAILLSPSYKAVHYELWGPSDGYISFGFSDDQEMGNDDIYICVVDSRGLVQLQHAFSTGTTTPQTIPLGNVSDVKTSMQDGVISCTFTSTNTISTQRSTGMNRSYYLLFAYGPSSNGQIQMHKETFVSSKKIDLTKPGLVQKAKCPHIIKAHGTLMLIAWMSIGSLGMMVARFGKGMATGQTLCGKDRWFVGVHPVLGCLVMILSLLQPLGALLRCGPLHPKRFLFNWSHALNAVAVKGLSVAAIFTGLKLIDSTENQWLMKVMGGFVAWEALYYIILDLNLRCTEKSIEWMRDSLQFKLMIGGPLLICLFLLGNLAFLVALLAGIGML